MTECDCTCLHPSPNISEPMALVFRSVSIPRRLAVDNECDPQPQLHTFGRHWKNAMVDLGALTIIQSPEFHPTTGIHIVSLSKAQCRQDLQLTDWTDRGQDLRLWVLQPQELLVALEFCWDDEKTTSSRGGGLTGVRITTTMRESPWYGNCAGARVERLEAPSQFCINGVFASLLQGEEIEVGVRLEPKHRTGCDRDDELASSSSCPLIRPSPELSVQTGETVFTVSHYHLRAISVTTDSSRRAYLTKVDILSERQYQRMNAANKHGHCQALLAEHEDMVVLSATPTSTSSTGSGSDGRDHVGSLQEKHGDLVMVAAPTSYGSESGDGSDGSDSSGSGDQVEAITKVEIAYKSDHPSHEVVVAIRLTTTHGGVGTWLGEWIQAASTHRVVTHETPMEGGDMQWKMTGFRGVCDQLGRIVLLEPVYHKVVGADRP